MIHHERQEPVPEDKAGDEVDDPLFAGMPTSTTGLIGWLVHRQPPAQQLDHIVVTDDQGRTIANRTLPYNGRGLHSWDIILAQLGFRRAGDWDPTPGGFACPVTTREKESRPGL